MCGACDLYRHGAQNREAEDDGRGERCQLWFQACLDSEFGNDDREFAPGYQECTGS